MKNNKAEPRVVLITGASRGIGRELALKFSGRGDTVYINYFASEGHAIELVSEIQKNGGEARPARADVSSPKAVNEMIFKIIEKDGRIDVVINNAGIVSHATVPKLEDAQWDSVIGTDLSSAFYITRACAKQMMKLKTGAMINISSISGVKGAFGSSNYAAAKAGLISFTKSAAIELGRFGITVNAVLPGFHMTGMGKNSSERYIEEAKSSSVLGLTTDMGELVDFIYMLSKIKTVSGQVFNWDSRII